MPPLLAFLALLRTDLGPSLRIGRPTQPLAEALRGYARQLHASGISLRSAVDLVSQVIERVAAEQALRDSDWSGTKVDAVAVELMAGCVAAYDTLEV